MKHIFNLIITLLLTTLAAPHPAMAQNPAMTWNFETIRNRGAIEVSANITDSIEGNFEWVEGVTGKGLRLDGFTTRVIRKGKDIRKPVTAFTIEAWVSLGEYPGRSFQSGLFGTWMHPQNDGPLPVKDFYTDVEGGLGWWNDTEYATETPKFIMGGVQLNFVGWANGPGAGQGRE